MPPMMKTKRHATAQTPASVRPRCIQSERAPGGPRRGSRQVAKRTAPRYSSVPSNPGSTPAMNSLETSVRVMMPYRINGTDGGIMMPRVAPEAMLPAASESA